MPDVSGLRVSLVAGATGDIGSAIARSLSARGDALVLVARRSERLTTLRTEIKEQGSSEVALVGVDLQTDDGPAVARDAALEHFGHIDVLVNNVGGGHARRLLECTMEDWHTALASNLLCAVRLCNAVVPVMRQRRHGCVVNVSSIVAVEPNPLFGPYSAAKAALVNYSKTLAAVCAPDKVRVTWVLPGLIATSATSDLAEASAAVTGHSKEAVMERMLQKYPIPLGAPGTPADIAQAVAWLSSDEAGWLTGSGLRVDGGAVRSP